MDLIMQVNEKDGGLWAGLGFPEGKYTVELNFTIEKDISSKFTTITGPKDNKKETVLEEKQFKAGKHSWLIPINSKGKLNRIIFSIGEAKRTLKIHGMFISWDNK